MDQKLSRLIEGLKALGKWQQRGLNADIARRTRFTPSYVGQVLKGNKTPGERFFVSVCKNFGINQDWVLNGNEPVLLTRAQRNAEDFALFDSPSKAKPFERVETTGLLNLEELEKFLYGKFGPDILQSFQAAAKAQIDALTLAETHKVMMFINKLVADRKGPEE